MDNRAVEGIATKALFFVNQTTLVVLLLPWGFVVYRFEGAIALGNVTIITL